MKLNRNNVIIQDPSWETLATLGRAVRVVEANLSAVHLIADDTTLQEVAVSCLNNGFHLTDSPRLNPAGRPHGAPIQTARFPSAPAPVSNAQTNTKPPDNNAGDTTKLPREEFVDPHAVRNGQHTLPDPTEHQTSDEWLGSAAVHLGVEYATLCDVVRLYSNEVGGAQKRRLLELAFGRHLERERKGESAYVDIRIAGSDPESSYHYLDNGSEQGGAHYFKTPTTEMKAEIFFYATITGLTVLAEGDGFVSVSYEKPAVREDVQFAEHIIGHVFGASMDAIERIDEVIDREETCAWLV